MTKLDLAPLLFQTFSVHRSPITGVKLSEKFLVSVCSEYNHVRTWGVTRFRGMISTQPGSTSVASFKIVSLEEESGGGGGGGGAEAIGSSSMGNSILEVGNACGPHGEQDDEQVTKLTYYRKTSWYEARFRQPRQLIRQPKYKSKHKK